MRRLLLAVAVAGAANPLFCPSAHPQSSRLTRALDARLAAPPFDRQHWGILVADDRGRVLYARDAGRFFAPASTAKLVVSATAALLLPQDFTVTTSVYATGPVRDGVLHGNLVLYGRGDPTWSRRCYGADSTRPGVCEDDPTWALRRLADSLRARGLHTVAGDLIGDGSWFEPPLIHPAWENYDLNWWYAAPVSALGFNDNSVDITWGAGPEVGGPPRIELAPALAPVTLENQAVTVTGDSGTTIDFFRDPGTLRIRAVGRVAHTGRGRTEHFALPDPNYYAAIALRSALTDAGIAVRGAVRSTTDSLAYASARAGVPLAEVDSRPLRDWIFPVLNSSQNWFAEMLLRQLGRRFGRGGSWWEGLAVERRTLMDSLGVDSLQLALVDGSGLAGTNLVTPAALVRLLQAMRQHPAGESFMAALPRAGEGGSLLTRFDGTAAQGHVVAKPGTITRVNALAGFLELEGGRTVTFAILANHHPLASRVVVAQIDTLVVDLARHLARRP